MMIKKIIRFILMVGLLLLPVVHAAQAETKSPERKNGSFIKPNFELLLYKPLADQPDYQLDYLTGLYVGYSAKSFNIMLGANYLIEKRFLMISTTTDYKLQVGIVHFLFGAEVGILYPLFTKICGDNCELEGVIAPHVGFAFDIGETSAIGIVSKVYLNFNELSTPYYALGLEARIGF